MSRVLLIPSPLSALLSSSAGWAHSSLLWLCGIFLFACLFAITAWDWLQESSNLSCSLIYQHSEHCLAQGNCLMLKYQAYFIHWQSLWKNPLQFTVTTNLPQATSFWFYILLKEIIWMSTFMGFIDFWGGSLYYHVFTHTLVNKSWNVHCSHFSVIRPCPGHKIIINK